LRRCIGRRKVICTSRLEKGQLVSVVVGVMAQVLRCMSPLMALNGQTLSAVECPLLDKSGQQSVWTILVNAIPVLKGEGKKRKIRVIAISYICIWCGQKKWDR